MEVIPAVDLRGGRCVRLYQGDFERETVFEDDPIVAALRWQEEGAERLHVVDLDGARDGTAAQFEVVRRIVAALRIPVQVGGGIRALETVERYLDAGANRFIVGTAAVRDPALVSRLARQYPYALVVGIDARDGVVATSGWVDSGEIEAVALAGRMEAIGVGRFVFTDIARDGTLAGPNLPALRQFAAGVAGAVVASGGIGSLAHIASVGVAGVEAVIVGQALYSGAVGLAEAIAVAKGEREAAV
jgi:phosphoribosylformimino-5-aminoimidazole carboxamide ribotide isomerase